MIDRKKNAADEDTHKVMQQKEQEIDDFMKNFDGAMNETNVNIEKEEEIIETLLEHMSKTLKMQSNIDEADMKDVGDRLNDIVSKTKFISNNIIRATKMMTLDVLLAE